MRVGKRHQRCSARNGKLLVLMALLLPSLIGVAGLVFDGGLMFAEQRDLQHVVDAAATAAAMEFRLGNGIDAATAMAVDIIHDKNGMAEVPVVVNIPPSSGLYAGQSNHVEVIAHREYQSYFMRVLDGGANYALEARAVAGVEDATTAASVVVLDPDPADLSISDTSSLLLGIDASALIGELIDQSGVVQTVADVPVVGPTAAGILNTSMVDTLTNQIDDLWSEILGEVVIAPTPTLTAGLEVEGIGQVIVEDAVLVNNEWGGVDEDGDPAGASEGPPYGVACMPLLPLTRLLAPDIRVVGGVDDPDNYGPLQDGDESPLQANRLPVPDPLESLPPPSALSDADNVATTIHDPADAVRIALPSEAANELLDDVLGQLSVVLQPLFQPLMEGLLDQLTEVTFQPGVYNSITALAPLGGIRFEPGVYIIRGVSPVTASSLFIVGPVEAAGVMFYITDSESYDPNTGLPDGADQVSNPPGNTPATNAPSAVILPLLTNGRLSGIDDPGSPYQGMLLYQRPLDRRPIILEAQQLVSGGNISGTIYSKWGHLLFLAGFGSYDLRFATGTLRITTVTDTTIAPSEPFPPAQDVLLLE